MSSVINQGAYGCILKPGIKCDGTKALEGYISKIQKKKPRTDNEPIIGKILREKVPQFDRYFAPALEVCPANLSMVKKNEIEKCKVYKNNKDNEAFVSIKIKYLGEKTLSNYLDIHYQNSPKTFISHVKDSYTYLADAIKELIRLEIVHNDLKLNNVMYSDKYNLPIIIDFGMAYQMKDLLHNEKLQTIFFTENFEEMLVNIAKYPPWCIQKLYIGSIVRHEGWETKHVNIDSLKQITKTFLAENPIMALLKLYDSISGQKHKLFQKHSNQLNKKIDEFYGKQGKTVVIALKQTWKTWDMYSLDVMYFMVMMDLVNSKYKTEEWTQFTYTLAQNLIREPY